MGASGTSTAFTSDIRERAWLDALKDLQKWNPPNIPTIVISPHPDDETLGAGGLIAMQRRRGVDVKVVAVTDGEAAYRDSTGLGELRSSEQTAALAALGVPGDGIIRMGLRDSKVSPSVDVLIDRLRPYLRPKTLLVAPWSRDPHPDHEACGRAAQMLARISGITLVSYVFWAWHHMSVASLTALPLYRLELDSRVRAAREAALSCHRSQLAWKTENPILPESLLYPARRQFETFIIYE